VTEHLQDLFQLGRRFSFLACNVALLVLALIVVSPIYGLISGREVEIEDKRETLARLQSIVALEKDTKDAVLQPEAQADQGEFLSGANEGVIGADLQTRLKGIAERNGTRIRSMQGISAKIEDPLRFIRVQMTIYGTLQRIQNTISEIEKAKPFLFVAAANLKLAMSTGNVAEEPQIDARLEVAGAIPIDRRSP